MDNSRYLTPRAYEMLTILVPDQGDEETSAAIERMLSYITDEQGTVDSVASDSPWGRRRLAYTIRHEGVDYRDGHYVLVYFTAMPSAISEIERELKLDTNVIRYLLLTHDPQMGEQIDVNALETESADAETASAPAEATGEPAETPMAVDEVPVEASEAPAEETALESSEAPAEDDVVAEVPAEDAAVAEAPAEDTAVAESTSVDAPATDDTTAVEEVAVEAPTEDNAAEAGAEESAADGEVETSTEE